MNDQDIKDNDIYEEPFAKCRFFDQCGTPEENCPGPYCIAYKANKIEKEEGK